MRSLEEAIPVQGKAEDFPLGEAPAWQGHAGYQPVASTDLKARRTRISSEDGSAVWREWGSGPTIVMLHGGAGSWSHFLRQVDAFSHDHHVIIPDLPGFGDSADCNPKADPERMARILVAGIDRLAGDKPIYLVGFSYGGIIGGFVARMIAPRIRGFVVVGGVGFDARRQSVDLSSWRHLKDTDERRAIHRKNLRAIMIANEDRIDETAIMIQQSNAERSRHDTRPTARSRPLTAMLDASKVPLAAIWGEHDQLAAPFFEERRAWLAERDPKAQFRLIADAGHWVQYEAADAFNAELRNCLRSLNDRKL